MGGELHLVCKGQDYSYAAEDERDDCLPGQPGVGDAGVGDGDEEGG